MRHLKAGRKLGRTSAHRKALFRNLVGALIQRERISTTLAKAKELRGKVEKTISLGKKGTLHARRQAFKLAPQKETVQKVFGSLAERYAKRPGGYTRIIKIGPRKGDNAPMAFIELVDREGDAPAPEKGKSTAKNKAPRVATKKASEQDASEKKPAEKKNAAKEGTKKEKETKKKAQSKKPAAKNNKDKE
jgi:large subunit ribosomal protein L17